MPDRPSKGEPDFDWLYGEKREERAADADHTRVLPTMQRPDERRKMPAATPPPPRDIAPTPGAQPPRRRRFGLGKLVLLVVLLYLVYLLVVPFWAWQRMDMVSIEHGGQALDDQPGTTYLVVGSDSRKGLSEEEKRKLGAGGVGVDGGRTDSIHLLHVGDGPTLMMSIPRDSIVPIEGHGTTKINAAFAYGGPKLLARTIEESTGVKIDHYVELGFGGFVNAVDAVGGVEICPTEDMDDPRANLKIKKGCQEVDGLTALGYSRSRYGVQFGDIGRAAHQREVIAAVGKKVKSPMTVLNPLRYYNLVMAAPTSLRVSDGTGPFDMGRFALGMVSSDLSCTIPLADQAVHWDSERAREFLTFIKEDRTADMPKALCTESGFPK